MRLLEISTDGGGRTLRRSSTCTWTVLSGRRVLAGLRNTTAQDRTLSAETITVSGIVPLFLVL